MKNTLDNWHLHDIEAFDALAPAWDRLNGAAGALPFLHSVFIRNLLAVFRDGGERIAVLGPEGRERAIAIVRRVRRGVWETYQPSQLPLGALVAEPQLDLQALLPSLLDVLPGIPLLVTATHQDPYIRARPEHTSRLRTVDYIETGWIEVQGTFDDYWAARSKNLQQNMRTQRSKLAKLDTTTSLEIVTDPALAADAVADYGRLESKGWKGAAGTAVTPDNDQGRFYTAVMADFCRMGRGRIYRYRFDDSVVAVDLCIESETTQVLLKTTYDESIKGLSPSSLLRQEAYRLLFDEGRIRRIEFYGPVMEWTRRWTQSFRRLYQANCYRWSFLPAAARTLSGLKQKLRRPTPSSNF